MYESFFGLNEAPFDLTSNPRYLFLTASHREALSSLEYGIAARNGVTVLVGEAGTGKTTLAQRARHLHE
jgi:general secretion pathway protein A